MHFKRLFFKGRENPEPKAKPVRHICRGKESNPAGYRPKMSFTWFQNFQWRDAEGLLGSVGKGKGWIYFLSIFRFFLESSHELVEAVPFLRCITKQRMRLLLLAAWSATFGISWGVFPGLLDSFLVRGVVSNREKIWSRLLWKTCGFGRKNRLLEDCLFRVEVTILPEAKRALYLGGSCTSGRNADSVCRWMCMCEGDLAWEPGLEPLFIRRR